MSSILADQWRPRVWVQMRKDGWGCGVSANEYNCAHHVTLSPNKLWRTNSIFNLCPSPSARSPLWQVVIAMGKDSEHTMPRLPQSCGSWAFHFNAEQDPCDANLWPLVYSPPGLNFWASSPPLWALSIHGSPAAAYKAPEFRLQRKSGSSFSL